MAKASSRMLLEEKHNSWKQGGGEASFRVLYYGGAAGSVPFMWESQPGTPKHPLNDDPPPPLTPPPSYQFSPRSNPLQKKNSKNSKFFNSIFPRVSSKKINASPASLSPPQSPPSSYSLPSTPLNGRRKSNFKARSKSAVHFGLDEDEFEPSTNSPTSTLCFGPRNGSPLGRFKGYSYPIKSLKKVMVSIIKGN